MRDPESISADEDSRLIPVWSIVAAAVAFVLVEYYFWMVWPEQQHHLPPLGFRSYLNISGDCWPRSTSLWSATSARTRRAAP